MQALADDHLIAYPLTLTNGKISAPCNVCSKKLTSPQRRPDQSVPGVTQKETPAGTRAFWIALPPSRCPQRFLLQPPVVTEVSLLVWHTGMKDTKLLLPGPKRNSGDPKGLWIGLFRCQTRARTQGIPEPPCTMCFACTLGSCWVAICEGRLKMKSAKQRVEHRQGKMGDASPFPEQAPVA